MRRLDRAGLTATIAALAVGGLITACGQTIDGTAQVNQTELASYTSEVKASSASISSSKAAAAAAAATEACTALSDNNNPAVDAFNAFISASDSNAPDVEPKKGAAITALRDAAGKVDKTLTKEVPADVSGALAAYTADLGTLADLLARNAPINEVNPQIDTFNATKDTAFNACKAY